MTLSYGTENPRAWSSARPKHKQQARRPLEPNSKGALRNRWRLWEKTWEGMESIGAPTLRPSVALDSSSVLEAKVVVPLSSVSGVQVDTQGEGASKVRPPSCSQVSSVENHPANSRSVRFLDGKRQRPHEP